MDYKEILKGIVNIINTTEKSDVGFVNICNYIGENCPELKESEDEKIRKSIIAILDNYIDDDNTIKPAIMNWLEKQGKQQGKSALEAWKDMRLEVYQQANGNRHEPNYSDDTTKMFSLNDIDEIFEKISDQKPIENVERKFRVGNIVKSKSQPMLDARKIISIDKGCYWCEDKGCIGFAWEDDYELVEQKSSDKVESKFHEGEWIILPLGIIACIDSINSTDYQVTTTDGKICDFKILKQDNYRLWTIYDAKDGDVLVSGDVIFIFNKIHGVWVNCYCSLHKDGSFCEENYDLMHIKYAETIYPSTKEQRDTLFAKMKEAGYEWDTENKCLTKI